MTKKHPAAAALAQLGSSKPRSWAPPDELVDDIIAARRNGASYERISQALSQNGVPVGVTAVVRWFKNQDQGVV